MENFKYFLILILFIPINFAIAQNNDNYDPSTFINNQSNNIDYLKENDKSKDFSKFNYNFNIGTGFNTSAYASFLNVYSSAQINYNFLPKWQFSTGLLIMNTTVLNSSMDKSSVKQSRAYIMNRLNYQANEKLRITGEILYGMNQSPYNISSKQKAEYYINFDAQYKINDNISVGLRVSGSNMRTAYGYNPYYSGFAPARPLYYSPFDY